MVMDLASFRELRSNLVPGSLLFSMPLVCEFGAFQFDRFGRAVARRLLENSIASDRNQNQLLAPPTLGRLG